MNGTIALLPDEQVVTSLGNGVLTLTTKRVRYDLSMSGGSRLVSIVLDSVASCALATKSYPLLFIPAAIAFIFAFMAAAFKDGASFILGFIVGSAFVLAYLLTRKAVISIASSGGAVILFPVNGMNHESIKSFIEAVEREKLK